MSRCTLSDDALPDHVNNQAIQIPCTPAMVAEQSIRFWGIRNGGIVVALVLNKLMPQ
jgi:hypothetical protein